MSATLPVPTAILRHLGGPRFLKVTHATPMWKDPRGVRFELPYGDIHTVYVGLPEGGDTYTMRFFSKLPGREVQEYTGVRADLLASTFELTTQIYVSEKHWFD